MINKVLVIMSDNEYFEVEDEEEIERPKPAKNKRKISEEQKKINIENLRRGRQKALENRQKKAELKKLEKEQEQNSIDIKLQQLKKAKEPEKVDNTLLDEIKALKLELLNMKEHKTVHKEDVKPAEHKPVNTIHQVEPKPAPIPVTPKPEPQQPPVFNINAFKNALYSV